MNLHKLLRYEPKTGKFFWLCRRQGIRVGDLAGHTKTNGYVCIKINGKMYRAHRLAWFYMNGAWPIHDIDHINRNRADNRWNNLREATRRENIANSGKRIHNKSGFKGVCRKSDTKWCAQIGINGKRIHLGYFDSREEAYAVYSAAAYAAYGEFADTASDAVN